MLKNKAMMRCPYCHKQIDENSKVCEHCGQELTLLSKFKGQHVQKRDVFSIDTLIAVIAAVLMVVVLFLPVSSFQYSTMSENYTIYGGLTAAGSFGSGSAGSIRVWFIVLYLVFDVIFLFAWFWGEKNRRYSWIGISGAIGSWLMALVYTMFLAQFLTISARANVISFTLSVGFWVWMAALALQVVALILYRIYAVRRGPTKGRKIDQGTDSFSVNQNA